MMIYCSYKLKVDFFHVDVAVNLTEKVALSLPKVEFQI